MLPFSRPSSFTVVPSTPSPITYEHGISPKHTLNVHDLDGDGQTWTVQGTVSKVSIYNSKNLTLNLPSRIVTSTIEMWQCSNVSLKIGTRPAPDDPNATVQPLGTLQLDPTLSNVTVHYENPEQIGKLVVAPNRVETTDSTRPRSADDPDSASVARSFGFRSVKLRAGQGEAFELADRDGNLHDPTDSSLVYRPNDPPGELSAQWVISHVDGRWKAEGLRRGAKDYPIL
ncbi:hypothetical protein JCM10212_004415 [Sporobolomyces blumeae]